MAFLLAIAAVVLLHAFLLWQRLGDWSIARPEVAIRWMAGAAIAFAALLLRRSRSRSPHVWIVFWLIVALLHLAGPAGAVLTQAVVATTPLLLLLVAVTMSVTCGDVPLLFVRISRANCAGVTACIRDRAPPPR